MKILSQSAFTALLLSAILTSCVTSPTADLRKSVPINISLDVAPGYRNALFLGIPEDGVLELTVRNLQSNPSKKWKPTLYLSFGSDESDVHYYINLSVDTDLNKMYARVRLIDVKQKEELLNRNHQQLYDLSHEFHLQAKIDGKNVSLYVDGELIDQQQLTFEPDLVELGASSGKFNVSLIGGVLDFV